MEKQTVYYDRHVVRGQAFSNYPQGLGEVGIAAHNVRDRGDGCRGKMPDDLSPLVRREHGRRVRDPGEARQEDIEDDVDVEERGDHHDGMRDRPGPASLISIEAPESRIFRPGKFSPLNNDSPAAAKFSPPTSQPEPHHGTQVMILKGDAASIQRGAGFASEGRTLLSDEVCPEGYLK